MRVKSELKFKHLPGVTITLDGFTLDELVPIENAITLAVTGRPDAPKFHEVDRRLSEATPR